MHKYLSPDCQPLWLDTWEWNCWALQKFSRMSLRVVGRIHESVDGHRACGSMPGNTQGDAQEMSVPFPPFSLLSSNLLFSSPHCFPEFVWMDWGQWGCVGRQPHQVAVDSAAIWGGLLWKLEELVPRVWLTVWGMGHPGFAGRRSRTYSTPFCWSSYQPWIHKRGWNHWLTEC